jgi:hypothetical protein
LIRAFSSRAGILGACIVVITYNWSVDTANSKITSINGTCIIIITILCRVNTSVHCITSIGGAFVFISANIWSMLAFSGCRIASISCAKIVVIAIDFLLIKALVKGAEPYVAFVGACCILRYEIKWSVDTSFDYIASVGGAWIAVVARNRIVNNRSSFVVTVVLSACILVINWFVSENATYSIIASINSA